MLETETQIEKNLVNERQLRAYTSALMQRITSGANRPRNEVETSIGGIYRSIGLDAPTVVWCRSPREMNALIQLLRILTIQQQRKPEGEAMKALLKAMKAHQNQPEFKELMSSFTQQIDFNTGRPATFGQSIHGKLTSYLIRDLSAQLSSTFDSGCNIESRLHIESTLRASLRQRLDAIKDFMVTNGYMRASNTKTIETTLKKILQHLTETTGQQDSNSDASKVDFFESWGAWDFYWIAAYEFAQTATELNFKAASRANELNSWLTLIDGALAYQLFEHFAFICEHPKLFLTDESGKLHNSAGPALCFADGDKYFAWHGCLVPDWVIERKRFITPALIDRQNNVEMRRVLIDIYGWERYLKNSRLKKLHQDNYGVLYCKDLGGRYWQSIFVVEVLNATPEPDGKRRSYLLRVPPNMKTAKEAVAWTFGMREEDYNPDFES